MQFTKTVVALTVACASSTAAQSCSPNNPTTTPCPPDFTCQALLGSMKGEGTCVANAAPPAPQKCNPNNPTTTPCPPDFTCQALLGNTNGEGSCVAASKCWMNMGQFGCKENDGKTSADDGCFATKHECNAKYSAGKCWMNMGQFGCKENDGKTSADDDCFATKHECNAKYSAGRKLRNEGEACNPDKLFSCGLLFKCEAMLGNTKHKGKCVRRQLPLPVPAFGKCKLERPNSCGHGKTCQALLGNTNGEGSCVAVSKCWMNMGQFGCKENDGKTSADDDCFATKHECNAKYSAGKHLRG